MAWRRNGPRRGPRPASTYRAARRNLVLRVDKSVWPGTKTKAYYQPPVRLNRSKHWAPKQSYGTDAR